MVDALEFSPIEERVDTVHGSVDSIWYPTGIARFDFNPTKMPNSFWNDLPEEKASEITTGKTKSRIVRTSGRHDDQTKDHKLRI
eukprot:12352449-Karenia_brevis.AAC.1